MKKQIILLCRLTIFSLVLLITGCGGGGGSSDYTLSPEQLEVATVVDAFAAAVQREEIDKAMYHVFSQLKYPNSTNSGEGPFKKRLENLFAKATVSEFTITGMGVDVAASEDVASVRALLTLKYSVDGEERSPFSENIELLLERDNKRWGIVQFTGYNTLMTTNFPPTL